MHAKREDNKTVRTLGRGAHDCVEEEEQRVVNIFNCFVDEEEECFEDDDDEERKRFEKDDAQHEEDATARIVVVV